MNDLSRRTLVWGGAGLLAAAAGAVVSWRRWTPKPLADEALNVFWAAAFDSPSGDRSWVMADFRGQPLVLNFWATWCPPCVEEMPLLDTFHQQHQAQGWQVLGLAVDQAPAVQKFLTRLPVRFPIGMAGLPGVELSRALGNATGGLPFTVVFSPEGEVAHRQIGKLTAADLVRLGGLFS
jgi:thiol-disulfide isomerase/thioredoxin